MYNNNNIEYIIKSNKKNLFGIKEKEVKDVFNAGLFLGLTLFYVFIFYIKKFNLILSYEMDFFDPSSVFAENLVHLYNII